MNKPYRFFILIIFICLVNIYFSNAQSSNPDTTKAPFKIIGEQGLIFQQDFFYEAGALFAKVKLNSNHMPATLAAFKAASEISYINNRVVLGPKIGLELNKFFTCERVYLTYYTDFKTSDWRFSPEIGLSFFGYITLCYGLNIPLTANRITAIGSQRLTINVNMIRK